MEERYNFTDPNVKYDILKAQDRSQALEDLMEWLPGKEALKRMSWNVPLSAVEKGIGFIPDVLHAAVSGIESIEKSTQEKTLQQLLNPTPEQQQLIENSPFLKAHHQETINQILQSMQEDQQPDIIQKYMPTSERLRRLRSRVEWGGKTLAERSLPETRTERFADEIAGIMGPGFFSNLLKGGGKFALGKFIKSAPTIIGGKAVSKGLESVGVPKVAAEATGLATMLMLTASEAAENLPQKAKEKGTELIKFKNDNVPQVQVTGQGPNLKPIENYVKKYTKLSKPSTQAKRFKELIDNLYTGATRKNSISVPSLIDTQRMVRDYVKEVGYDKLGSLEKDLVGDIDKLVDSIVGVVGEQYPDWSYSHFMGNDLYQAAKKAEEMDTVVKNVIPKLNLKGPLKYVSKLWQTAGDIGKIALYPAKVYAHTFYPALREPNQTLQYIMKTTPGMKKLFLNAFKDLALGRSVEFGSQLLKIDKALHQKFGDDLVKYLENIT